MWGKIYPTVGPISLRVTAIRKARSILSNDFHFLHHEFKLFPF